MSDVGPRIDSSPALVAALHWGFETAIGAGARCLTCVDASFEAWPLDDPQLLQRLGAWLRLPQRRLVLLAADYGTVPARHPRFNAWRRDWAHAIQAWQPPAEMAPDLPTLLLDDRCVSVHLIDPAHWRGRASQDARAARLWQERIDAVVQRSEPTFPANVLGL
jgi:hypothetical protein